MDLGLGADVDSLRRLVEDQDGRAAAASQRASATFCWLPPERLPTGVSSEAVLIPSWPTKPRGRARSRRKSRRPNRETARGSPASCWPPPSSQGSRRGGGGLREHRRFPGDSSRRVNRSSRGGRGARSRPSRPASGRTARAPARFGRRRPGRPAPGSRRPERAATPLRRRRARQPSPRTSRTTSPGSTAVLGNTAESSRPTIMRISSPRGDLLPSGRFRPVHRRAAP